MTKKDQLMTGRGESYVLKHFFVCFNHFLTIFLSVTLYRQKLPIRIWIIWIWRVAHGHMVLITFETTIVFNIIYTNDSTLTPSGKCMESDWNEPLNAPKCTVRFGNVYCVLYTISRMFCAACIDASGNQPTISSPARLQIKIWGYPYKTYVVFSHFAPLHGHVPNIANRYQGISFQSDYQFNLL
jgi:hypothetical protein